MPIRDRTCKRDTCNSHVVRRAVWNTREYMRHMNNEMNNIGGRHMVYAGRQWIAVERR